MNTTKLRLGLLRTSLGSVVSIATFDGALGDTDIKERQVWTDFSPKVAELIDSIDVGSLDAYSGVKIDMTKLDGNYRGIVISKADFASSIMLLGDNPAPTGIGDTGSAIHYVDVLSAVEKGTIDVSDTAYTDGVLVLAGGVSADKVLELYPNHLGSISRGQVAAYFAELDEHVDPMVAEAALHKSNGHDTSDMHTG